MFDYRKNGISAFRQVCMVKVQPEDVNEEER